MIEQNVESLAIAENARDRAAGIHARFSFAWKAAITIWIVSFFIAAFSRDSFIIYQTCGIIFGVAFLAFLILLIGSFITSLKEDSADRKLNSITGSLNHDASNIAGRYNSINKEIYQKVDALYLSSLSPEHREMVLMRRDQERQHREALQAQQRALQAQTAHNAAMEEEQQRIRQAQEELLQLEKKRQGL